MKQAEKQGKKNEIGAYGEEIVKIHLINKGFSVLDTNYLKKWGEIDLIAEKQGKIHIVEVKTVSYETKTALKRAVSYGTWRPEENVTPAKILKMNRAIESWLHENNRQDSSWQIDVAAVRVVPREKYGTIKYLPNIIT